MIVALLCRVHKIGIALARPQTVGALSACKPSQHGRSHCNSVTSGSSGTLPAVPCSSEAQVRIACGSGELSARSMPSADRVRPQAEAVQSVNL